MNDGENIIYAATDPEGDSFAVLGRDGYTHELVLHVTYVGRSSYVLIENPEELHAALGRWLESRKAESEHLAGTWADALMRLAGSVLTAEGEYTEVCSVCDRKHEGACTAAPELCSACAHTRAEHGPLFGSCIGNRNLCPCPRFLTDPVVPGRGLDVCSCGHTRSTHRSETGGCIMGRDVCSCEGFTDGVASVPVDVPAPRTEVCSICVREHAGAEWRTECGWCHQFVASDKLIEHKRDVCPNRAVTGLPSTCSGCGHVEHGRAWCGGTEHRRVPEGAAKRRCRCGEKSCTKCDHAKHTGMYCPECTCKDGFR